MPQQFCGSRRGHMVRRRDEQAGEEEEEGGGGGVGSMGLGTQDKNKSRPDSLSRINHTRERHQPLADHVQTARHLQRQTATYKVSARAHSMVKPCLDQGCCSSSSAIVQVGCTQLLHSSPCLQGSPGRLDVGGSSTCNAGLLLLIQHEPLQPLLQPHRICFSTNLVPNLWD